VFIQDKKGAGMNNETKVVLLILTAGFVLGSISFIQDMTITGKAVHEDNSAPVWKGPDSFVLQKQLRINLDRAFYDADGDDLVYKTAPGVEIIDHALIIEGKGVIPVFASDGQYITKKNIKVK